MRYPRSAFGAAPNGAEPGRERSGGPFVFGEGLDRKIQRGLQGTPADRRSRFRGVGLVALLALSAALPARAGLFDDDEARKAIIDLRTRITQSDEQSKARIAELSATNAQLAEQLTALRRSLLELNNQLEAMRGDLAKLRGNEEQIVRDVAELQRRQKDLGQGLDDRLRKLEPVKVTLDGREFTVDNEEKKAFDESMALIRSGFCWASARGVSRARARPAAVDATSVRVPSPALKRRSALSVCASNASTWAR